MAKVGKNLQTCKKKEEKYVKTENFQSEMFNFQFFIVPLHPLFLKGTSIISCDGELSKGINNLI